MKRILSTVLLLGAMAFGQSHTLPTLDRANTWTGTNTFTKFGGLIGTNSATTDYTQNFLFYQLLNPSANSTQYQFGISSEMDTLSSNTKLFSGQMVGVYGSANHFGSGNHSGAIYGGAFEGLNPGSGTANLVVGVSGNGRCGGVTAGPSSNLQTPTNNGNCTNIRGGDFLAKNESSGTVGTGDGVTVEPCVNTGGGSITTCYGIHVADQTAGVTNYSGYFGQGLFRVGGAATFQSTVVVNGSLTENVSAQINGPLTVTGSQTFNSETVTVAPRYLWPVTYTGSVLTGSNLSRMILDKGITVTRLMVILNSSNLSGCTTAPIFSISDGTNTASCTINNGAASCDSGAVSVNLAAAATTNIKVNAWAGCAAVQNAEIVAQYKMQ